MSSKPEVLKFEHWSELPGGLVNTKLLGSVPWLSDPLNPRWGPGIALLMSSQVVWMLLVWVSGATL